MPESDRFKSWSDIAEGYRSVGPVIDLEMAGICELFRDADWATDLHPWWSMGSLGVSTTSDYIAARARPAVWFARTEGTRYGITYQDRSALNETAERLAERVIEYLQWRTAK